MADNENENQNGTELENVPKRGRPPGRSGTLTKARVRFTPSLRRKFLRYLEDGYSKGAAAALCGINRQTYIACARRNPDFREAIDIATERANAALEHELECRIKSGTDTVERDEDGKIIKTTSKKSDTLLLRALEARNPERWGRKSSNTNLNVNVDQTSNSAVDRLASLLGVNVDREKKQEPIDITDADYEEKD